MLLLGCELKAPLARLSFPLHLTLAKDEKRLSVG
jgi:hypothetical protein